jgi:hypothetical protein
MGAPAVTLVSREINVPGCMGEFGPERGEFREISLHEAGIQDVEGLYLYVLRLVESFP